MARYWGKAVTARITDLIEIAHLRDEYRAEMNCQVIHDSIHIRPDGLMNMHLNSRAHWWATDRSRFPDLWRDKPALYEFYVQPRHRMRLFELFAALLASCEAAAIDTQTNARMLPVMLHTFATNIRAEAVVSEDGFTTSLAPDGASGVPRGRQNPDITLQHRQRGEPPDPAKGGLPPVRKHHRRRLVEIASNHLEGTRLPSVKKRAASSADAFSATAVANWSRLVRFRSQTTPLRPMERLD